MQSVFIILAAGLVLFSLAVIDLIVYSKIDSYDSNGFMVLICLCGMPGIGLTIVGVRGIKQRNRQPCRRNSRRKFGGCRTVQGWRVYCRGFTEKSNEFLRYLSERGRKPTIQTGVLIGKQIHDLYRIQS